MGFAHTFGKGLLGYPAIRSERNRVLDNRGAHARPIDSLDGEVVPRLAGRYQQWTRVGLHSNDHPQDGAMVTSMETRPRTDQEFVTQAILKKPPAFFAARGIAFSLDVDDLNTYEVAALALDNLPFALMRHAGTPSDETEILLPDTIPLEKVPDIVHRILAEFALPPSLIGWIRTRTDTPA